MNAFYASNNDELVELLNGFNSNIEWLHKYIDAEIDNTSLDENCTDDFLREVRVLCNKGIDNEHFEKVFDDYLNTENEVVINGIHINAAQALKCVQPTTYRAMYNDWISDTIDTENEKVNNALVDAIDALDEYLKFLRQHTIEMSNVLAALGRLNATPR